MGVQVGEQEREEGKLGDLVAGRVRRHHAAALPEVELAETAALEKDPPGAPSQLDGAVQVSEDRHEQRAGQARYDGRPTRAGLGARHRGRSDPKSATRPLREVIDDGEGPGRG